MEDLELGERLRRMGVGLIKCPEAVGYHWHPALTLDQIPKLIRVEGERARMGLVFFRKTPHPPGAFHYSVHLVASIALGALNAWGFGEPAQSSTVAALVDPQRLSGHCDGGLATSFEQDWRSYSFSSGKGGRTALIAIDLVTSRGT